MGEVITSAANPHFKRLRGLHEGRERRATGTMLIEGRRELQRAVAAGLRLQQLAICPAFWDGAGESAAWVATQRAADCPTVELAPTLFERVSLREGPDGLLATAAIPSLALAALPVAPVVAPLVLVVEAVEKPGNLGALLRTADGAGITAAIVCDPVTDVFNPHVIRASQGSVFRVPLAVATVAETLAWLTEHRVAPLAADPDAPGTLWQADWRGPVALVVGSEKDGLSPAWRGPGSPVQGVRIPMAGAADSLNVAAATAILLYEAVRQRAASGLR